MNNAFDRYLKEGGDTRAGFNRPVYNEHEIMQQIMVPGPEYNAWFKYNPLREETTEENKMFNDLNRYRYYESQRPRYEHTNRLNQMWNDNANAPVK